MNVVTIDMETYYDAEYSLSKLTVEEYVNDRRFQIIGVAIKDGDEPAVWYSFDTLEAYVKLLAPLSNRMVLCHNAAFDAAILSWRLGVRPKFLLDTLSMARPVLGHTKRHSLEALAEHFGLGAKGREVHDAKGKQLEDFDHDELVQYGRYCMNDVELTYKLFKKLGKGFPTEELRMIDLTLRMYTQPCLDLSAPTIWKEIELERERKDALMAKLGGFTTAADLRSNDKFAEVLRSLGVEPPTKVSVKKSEKAGHEVRTWAFAKADADFKALMNHDDPMVVAAVEARLGHKSTQKETRAQRFAGIAVRMGQLPVPLMYYGAHTGRYAATGSINLQNLPAVRGNKDPNAGLLRKAIIAPPGHKIVMADLSQIEARLAFWLAGQTDKVEAFAQGRDIYSEQASVIYSRHVDRKKNPGDFTAGCVGKAVVLGAQYGLGHSKFGSMIHVGMLGMDGILFDRQFAGQVSADVRAYAHRVSRDDDLAGRIAQAKPMDIGDETWLTHMACADHIVNVYRADNRMVKNFWSVCGRAIEAMHRGEEFSFGGPDGSLLRTEHGAIVLPNGLKLLYPGLERDEKTKEYSFLRKKEGRVQRVRVYGGALLENICQALARIVIGGSMLKADAAGYRVALQVHDEIVLVVREEEAETAYKNAIAWMRTPPTWAEGLPLDAEGGIADRYGDAK